MIDGDGVDLVVRPLRRRGKCARGNFLGFVERMPLGDGVGDVDGQELGLAAQACGGGDRACDRLVVECAHHHEGVER
jgi:hypothetical protein